MHIEPLELRIAPASVFTYTDVDGDIVKVTSNLGDLNAPGVATKMVLGLGIGEQLTLLDLRDVSFQGTNLSTTVTKVAGGDGLVNIGRIDATGRDLGTVKIKGDLAVLDAGDPATAASACKALTVESMGRFGLSTGALDLSSNIDGKLDKLAVKFSVKEAIIDVTDSAATNGKIGSATIGGSLVGGLESSSGSITARDGLGLVSIKGSVLGGFGGGSGSISSEQTITGVTLGGSLVGGGGSSSGAIVSSAGAVGPVKIMGSITGGDDTLTGRIFAKTKLASLSVGGSVLGSGANTVRIESDGDIGSVSIAHDLGKNGSVRAGGKLTAIRVGGSVDGGSIISGGDMLAVTVVGDVAANTSGGRITAGGKLSSVVIGGSLIGADSVSGLISGNEIGTLKIGRDVLGGTGDTSGGIFSTLGIASITIGGSVLGQSAFTLFVMTGFVQSGGDIGSIKIGGDVRGGLGNSGGFIFCGGKLGSVNIGGSLGGGNGGGGAIQATGDIGSLAIGGSLLGANGSGSGFISSTTGDIGSVRIGGDLRGGNLGSAATQDMDQSGHIQGGRIGSVFIGGSIIAGTDDNTDHVLLRNASIRAHDDIGSIVIRGSVIGNFGNGMIGNLTSVVISARGQETLATGATADVAIKSVSIGGSVALAKILGGFDRDDPDTAGSNGNASIGVVKVGGDWFASSISAGVNAGNFGFGGGGGVIDNPSGAAADAIVARIASITIRGSVIGAANVFFQCGFTAQQVGAFKAAGFTAPLTTGTDAPILLTPFTGNEILREM